MKKRYLFQLSAFLLGIIVIVGCAKFDDYESLDLDPAPTVTLTLVSAADSTITVNVTSSMNGYIAAILLTGMDNEVPDSSALLTSSVLYDEYMYMEAVADEPVTFAYTSVVQDSDYEVMAVAANEDGTVSDVSVLAITTNDSYAPMLVSSSPAFSYGPVLDPSVPLVLTFDEPVELGSGAFSYEVPWSGLPLVNIPADSVSVSGTDVMINLPSGYIHGDYFWLHWEAGAVHDAAGNNVEALTSIYDVGLDAFIGAYWAIANTPMSVQSITPDVGTPQSAGFDIVLTFSDYVGSPVDTIYTGDITLAYDDGAGMVTAVDVPAADCVLAGATLTISQTVFSPSGGTVTLDVPEGLLEVYYGNPVNAISETWDIASPVK